jgi:hypothetical protein
MTKNAGIGRVADTIIATVKEFVLNLKRANYTREKRKDR